MKTKRILIIVFNEFRPKCGLEYKKRTVNVDTDEIVNEHEFVRAPRATIYNEVYENGSGSHNHWNSHRAKRLYSHPLLKK